jgi:hypothetical protein
VIVVGVKIDEVEHGMRVRVLQVFDGQMSEGDTLMVAPLQLSYLSSSAYVVRGLAGDRQWIRKFTVQ